MSRFLLTVLAALFLLGCGGLAVIPQPVPTRVIEPSRTLSPLPSQTEPATLTQTVLPTGTSTASPLPTFTQTPTQVPEPQAYLQGPGDVVVPILLYHHVDESPSNSQYYVSPMEFEKQMYLLHEWGYSTISVELLSTAIQEGAGLPPKPIIITFDDGTISTFRQAFPIMQKYNFTGTVYVVYNYIGDNGSYMDVDQIQELAAAGWEIGSHSLSHVDLTKDPDHERDEIVESRRKLERLLGLPIASFAYPYGTADGSTFDYVRYAGYQAAAGLGTNARQSSRNLLYLYRMEVKQNVDLPAFASLLPWRGDMNDLPALTPVP